MKHGGNGEMVVFFVFGVVGSKPRSKRQLFLGNKLFYLVEALHKHGVLRWTELGGTTVGAARGGGGGGGGGGG